jgi:hypothetical protein
MRAIHVWASGLLGLAAGALLAVAFAHAGEPELTGGGAAIHEARRQLADDGAAIPLPPAPSAAGTLSTSAPGAPAELAPGAESASGVKGAVALERAEKDLADARARSLQADSDYSRMKSRNRPRGAARDEIVRERMAASQELREAQARYDELKQQVEGPASRP